MAAKDSSFHDVAEEEQSRSSAAQVDKGKTDEIACFGLRGHWGGGIQPTFISKEPFLERSDLESLLWVLSSCLQSCLLLDSLLC